MNYKSTRSQHTVSPSTAILNGLAADGGLYVPEKLMKLSLDACNGKSYQEIAALILSYYFNDIPSERLNQAIKHAYNPQTFSHPAITNLRNIDQNSTLLELFFGQTAAFKDQALSIYPYLVKAAMSSHAINHLTILTATSGDTGKAAMEALKDVAGLSIAVLYPKNGTSTMQALQMQTQAGNNVFPLGIDGNFDDAQHAVKSFFTKYKNMSISSANSINIARLLPQVIYYYDAFNRLTIASDWDVYVPTGNFGNALAAYIAREMGLPIGKIYVCTNDNNVLHDFFTTGVYDIRNRPLLKTHSPSMDILIASNLERLLYFMFNDSDKVASWMRALEQDRIFKLSLEELAQLQSIFESQQCSDEDTVKSIKTLFDSKKILVDPHTATALPQQSNKNQKLIVSTASPYKFPNVYRACFHVPSLDDFGMLDYLEKNTFEPYPSHLKSLRNKPLTHKTYVSKDEIESVLLDFIKKETQ